MAIVAISRRTSCHQKFGSIWKSSLGQGLRGGLGASASLDVAFFEERLLINNFEALLTRCDFDWTASGCFLNVGATGGPLGKSPLLRCGAAGHRL